MYYPNVSHCKYFHNISYFIKLTTESSSEQLSEPQQHNLILLVLVWKGYTVDNIKKTCT